MMKRASVLMLEKRFFNMTLEQKQGFVNMKMND
jgi:hypothetical protein